MRQIILRVTIRLNVIAWKRCESKAMTSKFET